MSAAITLRELFDWNQEASTYWKAHLDANPHLLALGCDIGGASNVQELVRHIWTSELRWSQRLAGLPVTPKEDFPAGPLDALYHLHTQAAKIFEGLLKLPDESWDEPYILDLVWVPEDARRMSRRKIAGHALFHGQRHWAQLATLVRNAGFPSKFLGDLLFSPALS